MDNPIKLGDVWYRVDGQYVDHGNEIYEGMELVWTTWTAVKITPCGAWFECNELFAKRRFALAHSSRSIHSTKEKALDSLIARKRRHLEILRQQVISADDTLRLALACKYPGLSPLYEKQM